MPLKSGSSHEIISANIAELIKSGHDPKKAEAIAYKTAGRARDDDPELTEDDLATMPNSGIPVVAKKEKQARDQIALDASPENRSRNTDGHLHVASSVVSAAQVNDYRAEEIPNWQALGLQAGRAYAMLRDPVELEKAVPSLHGKPLVIMHRAQTAADHDREITVGTVTNPVWESPNVKAEITVWDGDAIALIESGEQSDLSAGYRYVPVVESGEFNGTRFDLKMKDIEFNHLALVRVGRVIGAVVGDSAPSEEIKKMAEKENEKAKDAAEEKDDKAKDKAKDSKLGKDGLKDFLKSKLSEDDYKAACDAMESESDAEDGEEDDEDEKDKPKAKDKSAKDKKMGKDKDKEDEDDDEGKVSKGAMDAAIASAVSKATKAAHDAAVATQRGIREAEEAVRPYVGKLAMAHDSADAVYRTALTTLGVKVDGVHPSALPVILSNLPVPGSRPKAERIAMDSAAVKSFAERFPNAARVKVL